MSKDRRAALQVGRKSEMVVRLGLDDDEVVPSLHVWTCACQSIERRLRTVDPMLAVAGVIRLGVSWCRSDSIEEGMLVADRDEVESDWGHDGLWIVQMLLLMFLKMVGRPGILIQASTATLHDFD